MPAWPRDRSSSAAANVANMNLCMMDSVYVAVDGSRSGVILDRDAG
jgi:hypothetical protein